MINRFCPRWAMAFAWILLRPAVVAVSPELDLRHTATIRGFEPGIYSMALKDSRLFVCHLGGGLSIVDVADPANPRILGTYNSPGSATGVAVSGSMAYLCGGDAGLQVLDVSDPASPRRLGGFNTAGLATRAAVQGGTVFVADGSGGLVILDIGDPAQPRLVGKLNTPGGISDVAVSGGFAFLAAGSRGVEVVDVRDPSLPVLWTNINPGNQFVGTVALSGDTLHASAIGRAFTLDVRVPAEPAMVSFLTSAGSSSVGVAASSRFIGLAESQTPTHVFQNRGIAPPVLLGRTFVADAPVTGIAIDDHHAFVCAGAVIRAFSLEEPANPMTAATQPLPLSSSPPPSLFSSGDGFLRLSQRETMLTLHTGIPTPPAVTATNQFTPFGPAGWSERGDRAVGWNRAWSWMVDLSKPDQPRVAASLTSDRTWEAFALDGLRGFAGGFQFLSWLDLSDLGQPRTVTTLTNQQVYRSIAVSGDHLYLATQAPSVEIMDVRQPGEFRLLGTVPLDAISSLHVVSNRLYVFQSRQPTLVVYSLDNPSAPERIGALTNWTLLRPLCFYGSHLYARAGSSTDTGFEVLDVGDPRDIRRVGGNASPISALATDGRALYAVGGGQLRTLPLYSEVPAYLPLDPGYASGAFTFQVRGVPGTTAQVWRSEDLGSWAAWRPLSFLSEIERIEDPDPSPLGGRFYRVLLP